MKLERRAKIIELIGRYEIETQVSGKIAAGRVFCDAGNDIA